MADYRVLGVVTCQARLHGSNTLITGLQAVCNVWWSTINCGATGSKSISSE